MKYVLNDGNKVEASKGAKGFCPSCGSELIAIYSQIGSRIRDIRKAKGLSQEDLAKAVSLERPSMVLIESGRQKLPIDRLYAIARALDVQPKELLPSLADIFGENGEAPVFVHGGAVMEESAIYEIREIVEKKKKLQKRKAKQ